MSKVAKYSISLKVFLKNEKWEVLALKTDDKTHCFLWRYDFPWWRIDEDEFESDYIDILKREIFEETWIKDADIFIKPVSFWRHKTLAKYTWYNEDEHVFYIFFEWKVKDNEVKLSNEHEWYLWISLEEIELEKYFCSWILEAVKRYLELRN